MDVEEKFLWIKKIRESIEQQDAMALFRIEQYLKDTDDIYEVWREMSIKQRNAAKALLHQLRGKL